MTTVDTCLWCEEPILGHEPAQRSGDGSGAHKACALRMIVGSVAHLEKRCVCYVPGSQAGDPPDMSMRAAAEAAAWLFARSRPETLH